ncbi:hypothetical protein IHE45_17G091800 [Dioscorea alata]|uniref:Uncharacterized protein n=1 Tax=Dioscorea alata TaxID=55571 RepID=A0ACB7UDV1_DIOAL|nr:hypothetical protein IHE45_17G091800 [Dioscorea alata]
MASQSPPGDNSHEMYMELLQVTSQLMARINQNPQETMSILRAFPELARDFCRAMSALLNVGLPPYLPVEIDDQLVDDAYSPLLPQPTLGPPATPASRAPPQVQPPSAAAAEPVFDAGNDLGESSSALEEELPPPPSQTPPKSRWIEMKAFAVRGSTSASF